MATIMYLENFLSEKIILELLHHLNRTFFKKFQITDSSRDLETVFGHFPVVNSGLKQRKLRSLLHDICYLHHVSVKIKENVKYALFEIKRGSHWCSGRLYLRQSCGNCLLGSVFKVLCAYIV